MIKPTYPKEEKSSSSQKLEMKITGMFLVAFVLSTFISSITPIEDHARSQYLLAATDEMQKANYFTFVMLIKMSPPDARLEGNLTFLMPNDRMLANMVLQEESISEFLLRHSIPSPLLFGILEQFPTGTTIPSSLPNCTLKISNNGRRNFVVNNVKIISPNICVGGSSIRCHGIDGILSKSCTSGSNGSVNNNIPSCPNNSTEPSCKASPPIPSPLLPSAPSTGDSLSPPTWFAPGPGPSPSPSPNEVDVVSQKSGSPHWLSTNGSLKILFCLMLYLVL